MHGTVHAVERDFAHGRVGIDQAAQQLRNLGGGSVGVAQPGPINLIESCEQIHAASPWLGMLPKTNRPASDSPGPGGSVSWMRARCRLDERPEGGDRTKRPSTESGRPSRTPRPDKPAD